MVTLRSNVRFQPASRASTNMPPKTWKTSATKKKAEASKASNPGNGFRIRKSKKQAPEFGTDMIVILVGGDEALPAKQFTAHKSLLMTSSNFFRMTLSSSFAESQSGIVELPEETPELFETFLQFVYFNRLFISTNDLENGEEKQQEWQTLPRLYTLGERLAAPKFRDAVISACIEKVLETGLMPVDWANYVYDHTVMACPLRRLIVDFHVFVHKGRLLKKGASPDMENVSPEFLQEALARMVDLGKEMFEDTEFPWVTNPCSYHEHGEVFCSME